MYYEDENNLYHYSYRKGDTNVVEPVYNTRNYAEEPARKPEPAHRGGLHGAKLIAVLLCCALLGGIVGAGAIGLTGASLRGSPKNTTQIAVSERETTEVATVAVSGAQKLSYPELYKANIDSVVSINTTITTNVFNQTVQNASAGSGFIITRDGYIVTNYHVIDSADSVKVTLYNGETYDARVIGGDEDYDIAVLKIDAADLKAVTFGDSSKLQVGEDIAAIGNPLGELTFSMSEGIVSSVDRAINVDGTPFNMIQVTAAINPGNSGGPLFNSYGEVVGIVSAKYSAYANTSVEGLGFAIPINDVIAMVEDIMENGRVTNRPYLGISASTVTRNLAYNRGLSVSAGVLINSVDEGGAADKAGLQANDVIVKLGGKDVGSLAELTAAKKSYKAGDTAEVVVDRNGKEVTVQLTFDAAPEQTQQSTQQPQQSQPYNNYGGYTDPWEFFNDFFGSGGFGGYGGFGGGSTGPNNNAE